MEAMFVNKAHMGQAVRVIFRIPYEPGLTWVGWFLLAPLINRILVQ